MLVSDHEGLVLDSECWCVLENIELLVFSGVCCSMVFGGECWTFLEYYGM